MIDSAEFWTTPLDTESVLAVFDHIESKWPADVHSSDNAWMEFSGTIPLEVVPNRLKGNAIIPPVKIRGSNHRLPSWFSEHMKSVREGGRTCSILLSDPSVTTTPDSGCRLSLTITVDRNPVLALGFTPGSSGYEDWRIRFEAFAQFLQILDIPSSTVILSEEKEGFIVQINEDAAGVSDGLGMKQGDIKDCLARGDYIVTAGINSIVDKMNRDNPNDISVASGDHEWLLQRLEAFAQTSGSGLCTFRSHIPAELYQNLRAANVVEAPTRVFSSVRVETATGKTNIRAELENESPEWQRLAVVEEFDEWVLSIDRIVTPSGTRLHFVANNSKFANQRLLDKIVGYPLDFDKSFILGME